MELITFNKKNALCKQRKGNPTIRFMRKTGIISISATAAERMKLNEKTSISFAQDKKEPKDWYICTNDPEGFAMRTKNKSLLYLFNNAVICNAILDALKVKEAVSFTIGVEPFNHEGKQYWPIITSNKLGEK